MHLRSARIIFNSICAVVLVAAVYAVHAVVPPDALSLPGEGHLETVRFVPEGWAFFTKTPRTPELIVYRPGTSGGVWHKAGQGTYSEDSFIGFSRNPRAEGVELGLLVHAVPQRAWQWCSRVPANCLLSMNAPAAIRDREKSPRLCGRLALVQQERVPWAYRNSSKEQDMPSLIALLDVSCG